MSQQAQFEAWQSQWLSPIEKWARLNRHDQPAFARIVESLPALLKLALALHEHADTLPSTRTALAQAIAYTFDAQDSLPEAELGVVGFVDDAARLALALRQAPPAQAEALWAGGGILNELLTLIEQTTADFKDL